MMGIAILKGSFGFRLRVGIFKKRGFITLTILER
ncbi:MAG: hypothetical protein ACI97N_002622 [Cognaticolwellia sp.]